MNVLRQNIDALNGLLIVEIESLDYTQNVKTQLEKYRKTAKIPGFRPGHIPFGVIEKRFGKAVLAEVLNQLTNDGINRFIEENRLEILGNPIPSSQHEMEGSFDKPGTFKFTFEIGMASAFDYESVLKAGVEYHTIRVDDPLIDQQIEDIRRRYGKMINAEEVGEKDMVLGAFVQLNEAGKKVKGGINHNTTISLEFLPSKEGAQALLGKKSGESVRLDPSTVSKDAADKASLLGLTEETLPESTEHFEFQISEIKRMELAELNPDFFQKLYQSGEVSDELSLRTRVKKDLEILFERDADRMLTRKVYDQLLRDVAIEFPQEFLKKWIKMSASTPISDNEIEKEFEDYLKSLKWQLIQSKIFKDSNTKLVFEEVMAYTKGLIVNNYAQYGLPAPEEKELETSARELLSKKDQANNIYDQLAETKLTQYFKANVSLKIKPLSYDDFVAEMRK
ncbi:MAG: trigger factor [Bacteroidetes bacterium]|nr:trigger factor [Bacteroidota bacterium]MBM3424906.1 trigger factor [Bacteroidota bacterium]